MSEREPIGKYMEVAPLPVPHDRKTRRWGVYSRSSGILLGEVGWYSHWRQYTVAPQAETVFNASCLESLARFLERQTSLHLLARAARPPEDVQEEKT